MGTMGSISAMGSTMYTMSMWGYNGYGAVNAFARGDIWGGLGYLADMLPGGACFAAGTELKDSWTTSKPIEQFKAGDLVLSQNELDPDGQPELKFVEEVF